jgi:RNA polymerase sigma-70 factor (ECF subfamily)
MNNSDLIALCIRMQNGDQSAFETLYATCYVPLFRFVYRITGGNRDEAEDITQQAFLRVGKAISTFKTHEGNFVGWLYSIARHLVYDQARKNKRLIVFNESHEEVPAETGSPEAVVLQKEQTTLLNSALSSLSLHEQELLLLRYWNDFDAKQISIIVGKTHVAVRKELSRALQKLRRKINEQS